MIKELLTVGLALLLAGSAAAEITEVPFGSGVQGAPGMTSAGGVTSPAVVTDDLVVGPGQCNSLDCAKIDASTGDIDLAAGARIDVKSPASGPVTIALAPENTNTGTDEWEFLIPTAGIANDTRCEANTDGTFKVQGNCPIALTTPVIWEGTFKTATNIVRGDDIELVEVQDIGNGFSLSSSPDDALTITNAGIYRVEAVPGYFWDSTVTTAMICFHWELEGSKVGNNFRHPSDDATDTERTGGFFGAIITAAASDVLTIVYTPAPTCGGNGGTPGNLDPSDLTSRIIVTRLK